MTMKLSLISARSENNIIGNGPDIPWSAKGEQLLFNAFTYNQWLLVGRKTFESMGVLPDRKYAVVTRQGLLSVPDGVIVYPTIEDALEKLEGLTDHVFISGGGQIYDSLIDKVDTIHVSTVHIHADGDVIFPEIPASFKLVFEQFFESTINYTYQIWIQDRVANP